LAAGSEPVLAAAFFAVAGFAALLAVSFLGADFAAAEVDFGGGGGGLGVRRPLRFLAHKLELRETQVASLAKILNDLKTRLLQSSKMMTVLR